MKTWRARRPRRGEADIKAGMEQEARREILRQLLTGDNARLEETRAQDARLARGIRRATWTARTGTTSVWLGVLGGLGMGIAALLGAPLGIPAAAAAGVAALGWGARASGRGRVAQLQAERQRLHVDYEGRYLAAERVLAKIDQVRRRLAARYDRYERELHRRLGADRPEHKAPVLSKARGKHLAAVRRLDQLQTRCGQLMEELDKASRVVQAEERFREFELEEIEASQDGLEHAWERADLEGELETMVLEFESFTELEHLRV